MRLDTAFIRGMGKREEQFIMILDIDKVFSCSEVAVIEGAREETIQAVNG